MAGKRAVHGQQREQDQEERLAALEQQQGAPPAAAPAAPAAPAPAPAAAPATDVVGELTKLKGLLDAGVLTPEEFEQAKTKVLGS